MASAATTPPHATFFEFNYQGQDELFSASLAAGQLQNPILAGFYPDPSIVRVGDDYYLANSSFGYFPGVPIFHSKDLVNWNLIGHALDRHEQLNLSQQQVSHGIYAPTLRYHQGTFYLITTQVYGIGNFLITASNPAGPWSQPIALPEVGGIDPDIFFDDDGRVYIAHNDAPPGEPLYDGHRAIWLWELDLQAQQVIADSRRLLIDGGTDIRQKPIWIEGPHLYKINGWYYLLCAEGGTGYDHSAVVFRSKNLREPFVPYEHNPILTQRDLNRSRPQAINNAGHADFVQTAEGDWWAVFLAARTYEQEHFNTGRETFLLPVTWQDGWPTILPQGNTIPLRLAAPPIHTKNQAKTHTNAATTGNFHWRDNFSSEQLAPQWLQLRNSKQAFYQLHPQRQAINLNALPHGLSGLQQPAFLARRQQHTHYSADLTLALPRTPGVAAGIAAFHNEQAHYFLALERRDNGYHWFIERAAQAETQVIAQGKLPLSNNRQTLKLGLEMQRDKIHFYYWDEQNQRQRLLSDADASIFSSINAGSFVGSMVGPHVRLKP